MKKFLLISFSLVFCALFSLQAQDRTVSGKVSSADDGEGMIGVSVVLKGTTTGSITDLDGNYKLSVPSAGGTLVYSFIGMESKEVEIGGRSVINVSLNADDQVLMEVVVTGVAGATDKRKTAFVVDKIDEDLIKKTPGVNAATALQGKVAGVSVVAGSGLPGSNPAIRLRGSANLVGSQAPLVIIDGTLTDGTGALADINAEDIVSYEVVKGAAASSLYGSRAANGVINIITKRGSGTNGKTDVTVRNEYGTSFQQRQLDLATHHGYEMAADGSVDYTTVSADAYADNPYPVTRDHQQDAFDNGSFMTNSVSIASTQDRTRFYISAQNTDQEGVVDLSRGYNRLNIKANVDHDLSEKLTLSLSNSYISSTRDRLPQDSGSPFYALLFISPEVDLLGANEEDGSPFNWDSPRDANSSESNPLYSLANRERTDKRNRFIGNYKIEYRPIEQLTLDASYSLDRINNQFEDFIQRGYLSDDISGVAEGRLSRASDNIEYSTITTRATYRETFGDIKLTAQAVYLYEDRERDFFNVTGYNFQFGGLRSLGASTVEIDPGTGATQNRTLRDSFLETERTENVYGVLNLDYKDKLILDGLYRRDGSSLFGADNRYNNFYRVAAAYRISEDFDLGSIDELKVRASYGTAGNRPEYRYQYETYTDRGTKNTSGNRLLRSSLSKELEVGIDGSAMDNKITFGLTYAESQATNGFFNVPLEASAGGFSEQWVNIPSSLDAKVVEATLGFNVIQKRDMGLSVNFVFDRVRQVLSKFDNPAVRVGPGNSFLLQAGEKFGTIYGEEFARNLTDLNAEQQALGGYTTNSDGYLVTNQGTPDEKPVKIINADGTTLRAIGDINADFNLGTNISFNYKGLDIYTLFHWKQGGDVYNNTRQWILRELRGGEVDQSGTPAADKKPLEYYGVLYNVNATTEHFVEDGSFLKMRELAVTYSLPQSVLNSLGNGFIRGVKFGVIGRNLWTLTDYTGYDPEVSTAGDATNYMFDGFGYPNFATVTGTLELKF